MAAEVSAVVCLEIALWVLPHCAGKRACAWVQAAPPRGSSVALDGSGGKGWGFPEDFWGWEEHVSDSEPFPTCTLPRTLSSLAAGGRMALLYFLHTQWVLYRPPQLSLGGAEVHVFRLCLYSSNTCSLLLCVSH